MFWIHKAFIPVLCAVATASCFQAQASESEAVLQMRSVTEVDGKNPEISLFDVIVARGMSEAALAELKEIHLTDTPAIGETRSFTAMGIEQVVRPFLHEIEKKTGEQITLRVPTRVTVIRKTFALTQKEVRAALLNHFAAQCADCEFEVSKLILPALPPKMDASVPWKIQTRSELPKGNFSLPLEIGEDSNARTYWMTGTLTTRKSVPVAVRSISSGEKLRDEDFVMQMKDVTFATDVPPTKEEINAALASRHLSAGQIIWRSVLRREMAVKNGDVVKVMAGQDDWQIMIDGIAQTSGYIGDTVRVKIPRTQKLLSGLLTGKGVVEVQ